jgi:phosphoglycerate dehydrogenase-like enzyme
MYRLLSNDLYPNNIRVFILDTAPGSSLQAMLASWEMHSNLTLTLNNFHLPTSDRLFLDKTYPTISQVSFDPLDSIELVRQWDSAEGYSILTTRQNIPLKNALLTTLTDQKYQQPLRIIGQAGSTVSHIDLVTATQKNIAVTYTPGANAHSVAEFVLGQIFNLTRSLIQYNQFSHNNEWAKYLLPPQEEIKNKCLGIIGFGHIGNVLAQKASLLGMPIIVYTRTIPKNSSTVNTIQFVTELEALLYQANIISVHVPFTASTANLISEKEITLLQKGSFLINTSRGGIVDEHAIAHELNKENSKLAGVAFDVFKNEASHFTTPLIGCKNALLTPHIAGTTHTALTNAALQLINNIMDILTKPAPFLANPEVMNSEQHLEN